MAGGKSKRLVILAAAAAASCLSGAYAFAGVLGVPDSDQSTEAKSEVTKPSAGHRTLASELVSRITDSRADKPSAPPAPAKTQITSATSAPSLGTTTPMALELRPTVQTIAVPSLSLPS